MIIAPVAIVVDTHTTSINNPGTTGHGITDNVKHNTSTYISLLYYLDAIGMRWGRLSGVHLHFAKNVTFKEFNSKKKSKVTQSAIIKSTQP